MGGADPKNAFVDRAANRWTVNNLMEQCRGLMLSTGKYNIFSYMMQLLYA